MKYYSNWDLNRNQLLNAVIQTLASAPAAPVAGLLYYDSTLNTLRGYNGSAWVNCDATKATGIPIAALAVDPTSRANHTGTQTSATISDFAAAVQAFRLDQMAVPTTAVSMGNQRITNQADPVNPQDSATKNYVDTNIGAASAGIVSKPAVRVVASTNQATLSGLLTIDGVTLVAGDRVLLAAQTTTTQNGVYVAAAGAWSRASGDGSGNNELALGATWFVEQGTVFAASSWRLATPTSGAITPGTTAVTIVQNAANISYSATNGAQINGSVISAQVVAGGGVSAGVGGLAVDTTIVARKYSQSIGDGSSTAITITHGLGTVDVIAAVRDASGNAVQVDWQAATANTVIVTFSVAPAANAFRITIIG